MAYDDGKPPMAVGVDLRGESYGLLIDQIGEVLKLAAHAVPFGGVVEKLKRGRPVVSTAAVIQPHRRGCMRMAVGYSPEPAEVTAVIWPATLRLNRALEIAAP